MQNNKDTDEFLGEMYNLHKIEEELEEEPIVIIPPKSWNPWMSISVNP